jgi:outer membrane protein assembly factor BamB
LREYPLPLEETMRLVSNGCDDRFRYYPGYLQWFIKTTRASGADRDVLPKVRPHMHEAMAAMLGADVGGAAAYAARLADVARAALAGHKAGTAPAVGIGTPVDGDFGPYLALRMARCEQGVNAIPAAGADGEARWDTLDDWTCHGFVARVSSFETGPYLPELPIVPGLRPGGRELEVGKPVRLLQQDPSEHLWAWRARPDPIEGRVTIPRECLLLAKADEDRRRFSGSAGAGVKAETLDFYYNTFVTWYATSQVASEKRQRIHMAARIEWDGRVWVNDRLVWRPSREHTPDQVAVFPVDLEPGVNRVTVGCSMRQLGDGNTGDPAARIYEYGELAFGSFTVWVAGGDAQPRSAEAVAHARAKQTAWDKDRATARSARGIRGRRGDGTGLYRDAKPPVAWDIDKGINIRWKKMIRTDDAEPVIQGGRLFVTTYTGEAVCLDAQTGDELWRKKPQTPGNTGASAYPPAAITASFGQSARMWRKDVPATLTPHAAYARSCLTPVADARHVWMHDPRGTVACFDHDGKQLWARSVAAQTPRFTEGGYLKQRLLPPTHPSVAGSKLIVAVAAGLSAFDLESGKLAWERPSLDYLGQFAVMGPVDGAGDGLVLLSSGEVLDADTGKTLIARVVPLIPDGACEPVVDGRTAWFGAASTAVRFWRTASGALCGRVLWHTSTDIKRRQHDLNHHNGDLGAEPRSFSRSSAYPPTPVLMDGLLYEHMGEQMSIDHGPQQSMRLHTWDAATGCAVSQRYGVQLNATHPVTSTVIAGGMIFCADEGGFGKGDYPGFPQEPSIVILTAEEQPRRVTRHQPGLATMSPPTFQGECMYLAGEDQVVCVGRPKERGERFTEHELAALRQTFFALEVGEPPATGADQAQPIAPLADAGLAKGAPVVRLVGGKCPDRWLYAGPFLVSENTDVFKDAGGAGALHPEPGQTMRYTKADGTAGEVAFVMLDDIKAPDKKPQEKKLIDAAYAKILGNPSLEGGINLATASGRQYFTTSYACTVVEVTQPGRYRVEMHAGRIQSADLFLGGRRVEPDTTVELSAGRYPLMLRAAIGICGNWEPIQWAVVFIALPAAGPVVPPEPLAGPLPAGLRTPVAPLILASLPPRMLGAWPLDGPIQGNPYERMSGQSGSLIGEGTRITHGGKAVEFRPLPPGAIDTVGKRGVSDGLHLNVRVNVGYQHGVVEELGLAERAIFGDTSPSAGLFFAVLSNPRTVCVKLRYSANTRCWLSGREVPPYITIQLKPGLYPFLLEYRSDKRHDAAVLPLVFQEVADPAIEQRLWLGRVRCNADMLRRIAESGPAGVYVKPALDALGP